MKLIWFSALCNSNFFEDRHAYNQWKRGKSMDTVNELYNYMNEFPPFRSKNLPDHLDFISFAIYFCTTTVAEEKGENEQDS